jgi:phosphatidylinositol alpha-1,6-mannosyltransferase
VSSTGARCVTVARLIPQKGIDTLLRAWRTVMDSPAVGAGPRELIVIGDGPLRARAERTIHALGLSGSIRLLGALPRAKVITYLQQSDVFALPVRTRLGGLNPEGLGLAALEAAACGLPVVVGDSGGAPETIRDGDTGFVVPSRDHQLLAEKISLLLDNPSLARDMGARGRRYVTARFSTAVASGQLRNALDL